MSRRTPLGYVQFAQPGARVLVRHEHADALVHALSHGTVYDWAAAQPDRRVMQGRRAVYLVPLPFGGPTVAVRRNAHGGWLAALRGDRFLLPKMRSEVFVALALASVEIPTPDVIALVTYRINAFERRVDVVTRELPPGVDFGTALTDTSDAVRRAARWQALSTLLGQLAGYGVWHQDLNVKNVYMIEQPDAAPRAALLDVDRVRFHSPGALVARANVTRLVRSIRKWQRLHGVTVSADEIALINRAAGGA